MFEAKKANATLHKGAGQPINGMKSAKVGTGSSFSKGAKEGQNVPFNTKQNGGGMDTRKEIKYED